MRTPISLRLVLGIVTIALLSIVAAGAVSPLPALASGLAPTKWVFSFYDGRNVNETAVEEGAPQEQRNGCTAASRDTCLIAYESGVGPREFGGLTGVAVSKLTGDVYVAAGNHHVQVLDREGRFLFMFGWNVNKTRVAVGAGATQAERNLCTAASENDCGEGEAGTGLAGQMGFPESISVDPSTGDIYLVDLEYHRVEEYTEGGTFLLMVGGEVNKKGGDVCTRAEEAECRAGVEGGSGPAYFKNLEGNSYGNLMTVGGPEGLLYVGQEGGVQELEADGTWVRQISVPGRVTATAVNAEGDLFVADTATAGVHEYNAKGELQSCVIDPTAADGRGLALDSAERLAVTQDNGSYVALYETQGASCGKLVDGELGIGRGLPAGLAFNLHENGKGEAEDQLYIANPNLQEIEAYSPVIFPEAKTCATTGVTFTSAELCGEVNPNGLLTQGFFKYGTAGALTEATGTAFGGEGTAWQPVSEELLGLIPNQTYFDQAWVQAESDGAQQTEGATETSFHTHTPPPEVPGEPSVSDVTDAFALLTGSVNPEHAPARYHFEYGQCAVLAGCAGVASTTDQESSVYGQIAAIQEVTGLQPQATYSYRLVADNEHEESGHVIQGGETIGVEGHFTTGVSPVPVAQTGPASGVGVGGATISGLADPDGQPAVYVFELGVYEGAGTRFGVVFSGPAGASTTPVAESLPLSGLQPGTTYAYRIVVRSGYGEAVGETLTFTTEGLPAVLVVPAPLAMLAVPDIAFPGETQGHTTVKKATVKCKRGKQRENGTCVTGRRKKHAKNARNAGRAGRAGRSRKAER